VGSSRPTLEDAIEQGSLQHCGDLRGRRFRVFDGTQNVYPSTDKRSCCRSGFEVTGPQGQRARASRAGHDRLDAGLGYCVTLGLSYSKIHSLQFNTTLDVTMVLDTIAADGDVEFAREFEVARVLFEPETIPAGGLPIVLAPEIGVFVRRRGQPQRRLQGVAEAGGAWGFPAPGRATPTASGRRMRKFTRATRFNPTGVPGTRQVRRSVKPQVR